MKSKIIYLRIFIISLPFIIFGVFGLLGDIKRQRFFNSKIEAKIIDSSNWQLRTCEYYLPNDLQIDVSLDTLKLFVGDSISKKPKSWQYKVFRKRKQETKFRFINSYKMN